MRYTLLILVFFCLLSSCKNDTKVEDVMDDNKTQEVIELPIEKPKPEIEKQRSVKELKAELVSKGYELFDYVDEKTQDTILMQKYFMAFLKNGPIRNQNEEEANRLQGEHLAHLGKMYDMGYADISGPFDDDGDIRGITIYNVPTLKMADSLANADPMVKAGRLVIEIHPWWAAKGFPLR